MCLKNLIKKIIRDYLFWLLTVPGQQQLEVAGHIVASVRNQREVKRWCLVYFLLFIQDRTLTFIQVALPVSIQFRHSLVGMPRSFSPRAYQIDSVNCPSGCCKIDKVRIFQLGYKALVNKYFIFLWTTQSLPQTKFNSLIA